ncbi:chromosomal replication initiation protein DnaA [candidate division WOR-1 bacterium RIFOXYC2_FULL_37_10]|uniref:Chromosomal replication initiator protein DnaA n=1 Tax=candidate division WOR-1 bacterium RIFOXYB2_FULL_37_13 TaxID=1802579 RepID=A0A1F4SEI5_UNCSA|nr:MAG: chromosomal replication initiation protein DnaA [candidate division WOR-1 bacterium RIFOXYA2_FULL_37_7]OGC18817.1 MAG: chromosomal replication initiation protein DnaA [candidate division WOR-1 bacterium RIFOXYB2_FULL_37_13]OGC32520.1 MAG: chromosomal replication initiation protein DnaA [candidate division WOR-1 bacterium RIFOXYC2_FULL_37_10]
MNESVDIHKIWSALLPAVEKSLTKPIYETLISSTKPISFKEGILEIGIPHNVIKEWLSKHCHTILEEEIKTISPKIEKIVFTSGHSDLFQTPNLNDPGRISEIKDNVARSVQFAYLNPRYTFDSFVVGNGNRFAHAAALAVAEAPATAYNPLFLYGGVGLGKTHLMQAIGYSVLKTNSKARVLYITCEMFTNELITSIKEGKMQEFRNKYRTIDLLMVDDIQFLAGKERTQEEFFHTFNTLHDANKQIIVSSDRPPKEIPTLEERLRSRFEWGLIADIQSPDFETRIAILRKKAEFVDLIVPDEVTQFIASRIDTNIRELEGALIRVIAFASLSNAEVSISLVEQVLKDITSPANTRTSVSVDLIKKATAEYYSVKIDDMSAKIRTKEIATARQVAMFLCRELTPSSLPKIGEEFGGRDHTTVIHANEKIKNALKFDKDISEAVKNIKQNLKKYAL